MPTATQPIPGLISSSVKVPDNHRGPAGDRFHKARRGAIVSHPPLGYIKSTRSQGHRAAAQGACSLIQGKVR
jgi:hypothetical protein